MKTKKIISLLALVLSAACLASCTSLDRKVTFNNYWNKDSLVFEEIHETLVYDVTYDKSNSISFDYELSYANGKYTTVLESTTAEGKNAYLYKTELAIEATYTLGNESTTLQDRIATETLFLTAENGLRPISSKKTLISSTPVNGSAESLEDCYQAFHYEVETTYNTDGAGGKSVVTSDPDAETPMTITQEFEIDQEDYSYLDNEQLLFALRGIPSSKSSATVLVYSPFVNRTQSVSIAFSSEAGADFQFYRNGSAEKERKTITYRPVTVKLNEQNPGATQTAWIAKATNPQSNEFRNIMLRLETPLSYGLGTLIYELNSVSYQ